MRKYILPLLLHLVTLGLMGQGAISGTITSDGSGGPVPYATVYINGTSNGTITNEEGYFSLDNVSAPSQLVVSHLTYVSVVHAISQIPEQPLSIIMKQKNVEMNELSIEEDDRRNDNIGYFKNGFLGMDYWGENAILLNDSVLRFQRIRNKVPVSQQAMAVVIRRPTYTFNVTVDQPLVIDMPKLGYTLNADLMYYTSIPGRTSSLGYFYYQPYEVKSRFKRRQFAKNRRKAYFNSVPHFCKALCTDDLDNQGYAILTAEFDSITRKRSYVKVDLDTCITRVSPSEIVLKGLEDSYYHIFYFYNLKGEPTLPKLNLARSNYSVSRIYFSSDSCIITKNGIIPGYGVSFDGDMTDKRAGATLPNDYDINAD